MPAQSGKSAFASRVGKDAVEAFEAHKDDEVKFSGGASLPPGIEAGVAELVDCRIGQYKDGPYKGKDFFIAAAVVKEPREHNGQVIAGQRTQIGPMPICQTTTKKGVVTSVKDNYNKVMNEAKKLGLSGDVLHPANIENGFSALLKAKVHTRFRTWQGKATAEYPNPQVNHDWRGVCQYNGQVTDGVQDNSGSSEESPTDETPTDEEVPDLASLVETADGDDEEQAIQARTKLTELAIAAGKSQSWVEDDAKDWQEVADAIEAGQSDNDEGGNDSPEWEAKKGEVCLYKPFDKKAKKKAKKAINCEITSVNKQKETVSLLSLVDRKTKYDNVPFSDLEHE